MRHDFSVDSIIRNLWMGQKRNIISFPPPQPRQLSLLLSDLIFLRSMFGILGQTVVQICLVILSIVFNVGDIYIGNFHN